MRPGEGEEEFEELCTFLREARIERAGVFPFSPEEGTPAAKMPDQIPEEVKQERLDRLMTLQQDISLKRNRARIGSVEQVLVTDTDGKGNVLGRSSREAPETDGEIYVFCKDARPEPGQFIPVRIDSAEEYDLRGTML